MGCAAEVAAFLAGQAALGLTAGGNLFDKPFPAAAVADPAVCIHVYSGEPSDRAFGSGGAEYPHFHVFVRAAQNGLTAAETLADRIYALLDGLGPQDLSGTRYDDIRSVDGPPKFAGYDPEKRGVYVLNFKATKDRSAIA